VSQNQRKVFKKWEKSGKKWKKVKKSEKKVEKKVVIPMPEALNCVEGCR
jgi:hypothetical protein